jgi:ABC-2 type transport system ATP-binding protein
VDRGDVVGLLGPNGAGKTSVIKMLLGLVHPDAGEVMLLGRRATDPAARARVGYLPELFRYQPWLSAAEVLALHVRLSGIDVPAREQRECLALVGLAERAGDRVGGFSKGMQQRLGLAQAMIGSPRLLLLDEPTSALDPAGRRLVRSLLEGLRADGVSVLLNSHLLSEVELVCDRVAIIARGELVAAGTPAELSTAGGVEVETASGVKRWPDATREDAPRIVADLVAAGEAVYEVRVLRSSLEDAYLAAVGAPGSS